MRHSSHCKSTRTSELKTDILGLFQSWLYLTVPALNSCALCQCNISSLEAVTVLWLICTVMSEVFSSRMSSSQTVLTGRSWVGWTPQGHWCPAEGQRSEWTWSRYCSLRMSPAQDSSPSKCTHQPKLHLRETGKMCKVQIVRTILEFLYKNQGTCNMRNLQHNYNKHTFAGRFSIRPFLNFDHVSRSSNEVLVLICGVQGYIIRVPGLRQSDLCTLLGNFLNLEKHSTLEQVDVLKEPQRELHNTNKLMQSKFTVI